MAEWKPCRGIAKMEESNSDSPTIEPEHHTIMS